MRSLREPNRRPETNQTQVNLKDQYKRLKVQLEHAMSEYESTQVFIVRL